MIAVAASVAIATRDRPEALARCLESLAGGELLPAEVIVVDQGADDRSAAVVAGASQRLAARHLRQEPRGLGAAQNVAVAAARHGVIAVLDDDCVADRRWLATHVAALADPAGPDLVAGRVEPLPPAGERTEPVASRRGERRCDFRGRTLPWAIGSGNNFALRRTWFERVGGCDERLGPGSPARGGVDMDLFYRLLRAGALGRYEPAAVVYHERQTAADRRARRPMYGRGMGTAVALWLRDGDAWALRVLASWTALRTGTLLRELRHGRVRAASEELLMLGGTTAGLVHGLRLGRSGGPRLAS